MQRIRTHLHLSKEKKSISIFTFTWPGVFCSWSLSVHQVQRSHPVLHSPLNFDNKDMTARMSANPPLVHRQGHFQIFETVECTRTYIKFWKNSYKHTLLNHPTIIHMLLSSASINITIYGVITRKKCSFDILPNTWTRPKSTSGLQRRRWRQSDETYFHTPHRKSRSASLGRLTGPRTTSMTSNLQLYLWCSQRLIFIVVVCREQEVMLS